MSTHEPFNLAFDGEYLSLAPRVSNALLAYAAYLAQSFVPVNLSPFYPHLGTHLPIAWAAGALVLLLVITAIATLFWRRLPYLLVGWLWFVGMLVPVLGLVGGFLQARADRYTYLSQIGLSIALAWSVWTVYQSRQALEAAAWRRWTLALVSGAAVLLLGASPGDRLPIGKMVRRFGRVRSRSPIKTRWLTIVWEFSAQQQGRSEEAIGHFRQALASYSISRHITAEAHIALAGFSAQEGKNDEALEHYERAVSIFPNSARCHARLAQAWVVEANTIVRSSSGVIDDPIGANFLAKRSCPGRFSLRLCTCRIGRRAAGCRRRGRSSCRVPCDPRRRSLRDQSDGRTGRCLGR